MACEVSDHTKSRTFSEKVKYVPWTDFLHCLNSITPHLRWLTSIVLYVLYKGHAFDIKYKLFLKVMNISDQRKYSAYFDFSRAFKREYSNNDKNQSHTKESLVFIVSAYNLICIILNNYKKKPSIIFSESIQLNLIFLTRTGSRRVNTETCEVGVRYTQWLW